MASGTSRSAAKRTTKKAAAAEAGSEKAAAASKPELVDATRYDFERLESVVTDLVLRHRALQDENSALREQIAGGLAREQQLEAELADLRARRERSRARLDKMLDDLGKMEAALTTSSPGKESKTSTGKRKAGSATKKSRARRRS